MCGAEPSVPSCLSDLEKSVEEIQKESSVNHKLVTVQELEEKSAALRKLGETLTELKSESRRLICSFIYLSHPPSPPHFVLRHSNEQFKLSSAPAASL